MATTGGNHIDPGKKTFELGASGEKECNRSRIRLWRTEVDGCTKKFDWSMLVGGWKGNDGVHRQHEGRGDRGSGNGRERGDCGRRQGVRRGGNGGRGKGRSGGCPGATGGRGGGRRGGRNGSRRRRGDGGGGGGRRGADHGGSD